MNRCLRMLCLVLVAGFAGCQSCGTCSEKKCGSLCLHCFKVYEQSPQYRPPGPWFADLDCCERSRAKNHGILPDDDLAYSDGYANDSPEKQYVLRQRRKARGLFGKDEDVECDCDYPHKAPLLRCPPN